MNPELIEQTVRDYSGKLLKIAYTYTKNTCDAEDIVQEVFLSFITSRQEFASQEHIRAWLIRVTINKSIGKKRMDCETFQNAGTM